MTAMGVDNADKEKENLCRTNREILVWAVLAKDNVQSMSWRLHKRSVSKTKQMSIKTKKYANLRI